MNTIQSILRRFTVDSTSGCWLWTGTKNKNGYGKCRFRGRMYLTHRLIYEHFKGRIPKELETDHLCRNRVCGNPEHLEPVTHRENVLRSEGLTARRAAQTHCKRGHPFDDSNTYISPSGGRSCRICRRNHSRKQYPYHDRAARRQYARAYYHRNRAARLDYYYRNRETINQRRRSARRKEHERTTLD